MMGQITTVDFRDDTLFAVERDDGVFVAVKPICDTLGIEWRKQHERLRRDPVLAEGITMMVIPSPGGPQETTLLRLDLVHGWLFTIDESRVKDEDTRQKVLAYKRECYAVLHAHFTGRTLPGRGTVSVRGERLRPGDPLISEGLSAVREARLNWGREAATRAWAEWGLPDLGFGSLTPVPAVTDPWAVDRFLNDCCDLGPGLAEDWHRLYAAYRAHADTHGHEPANLVAFGLALAKRGFQRKRVHAHRSPPRYRVGGVRLRESSRE